MKRGLNKWRLVHIARLRSGDKSHLFLTTAILLFLCVSFSNISFGQCNGTSVTLYGRLTTYESRADSDCIVPIMVILRPYKEKKKPSMDKVIYDTTFVERLYDNLYRETHVIVKLRHTDPNLIDTLIDKGCHSVETKK